MSKILILGGTREAAKLAQELYEEGNDVMTSLAGRTKEPEPLAGEVRIGGFGGAEGLKEFLLENKFDQMIDATHPFAKQISANAIRAAEASGIAFEVLTRPPWQQHADDIWIECDTLEKARDAIPQNARVLLALGSQHIDLFKTRDNVHFLVRMVDAPREPLPLPDHQLLIGKPSTDANEEAEVLTGHAITHIVCRNSGGKGAYAKIEAARLLRLPVIIVRR